MFINPVERAIFAGEREAAGGEARLLQPPAGAGQGGQDHGGHSEEDGGC